MCGNWRLYLIPNILKCYRETDEKGWKNSIRHNLSLNPHFYHVPRLPHPHELSRKGGYWRIDSIFESRLVKDAFAKKKKSCENRKYVKYLGCNKRENFNIIRHEGSNLNWVEMKRNRAPTLSFLCQVFSQQRRLISVEDKPENFIWSEDKLCTLGI